MVCRPDVLEAEAVPALPPSQWQAPEDAGWADVRADRVGRRGAVAGGLAGGAATRRIRPQPPPSVAVDSQGATAGNALLGHTPISRSRGGRWRCCWSSADLRGGPSATSSTASALGSMCWRWPCGGCTCNVTEQGLRRRWWTRTCPTTSTQSRTARWMRCLSRRIADRQRAVGRGRLASGPGGGAAGAGRATHDATAGGGFNRKARPRACRTTPC